VQPRSPAPVRQSQVMRPGQLGIPGELECPYDHQPGQLYTHRESAGSASLQQTQEGSPAAVVKRNLCLWPPPRARAVVLEEPWQSQGEPVGQQRTAVAREKFPVAVEPHESAVEAWLVEVR
jgi:hypothetical protein